MSTGVDIVAEYGVRKPAGDDQGAFGSDYRVAQSVSEVTLVLGSASVALMQGLVPVAFGAGLHLCVHMDGHTQTHTHTIFGEAFSSVPGRKSLISSSCYSCYS